MANTGKRLRVIAFKVTDDESAALEEVADRYTNGNISELIRMALQRCPEISAGIKRRSPAESARSVPMAIVKCLLLASLSLVFSPRFSAPAVAAVTIIAIEEIPEWFNERVPQDIDPRDIPLL